VIKTLKQERPSLLHVHFGIDAIDAWPIAKALDVPMLVTLWGYDIHTNRDWWEAGLGGRDMRNYPDRLLQLARIPRVAFIAVSDAVRDRAITFGIPKDRIWLCHPGVNVAKFAPRGRPIAARERRVLFVGRLVEKKGCEYLIKAFVHVQKTIPDASLMIVGEGPLRAALEQLAIRTSVHAQFRGALPHDEISRELSLARAFCLPSVRATNGDAEGFGIVVLEAEACGVPVVSSAVPEAVDHGVTGFLATERDVDALAAGLITILTNDAIAASMSSRARKFVCDNFELYRCTERLESVYDSAAQEVV
jgi:glycosyltransferase involved in cell wall biosynthesis